MIDPGKITIRKFRDSDVEAFLEAVLESIVHLSAWLPWCREDYNINDAADWIASAAPSWENGTDYRFIIEDQSTGRILGSVGINQIVQTHKIGNLGYWVRKSALNLGVCTQAARLAIQVAFQELGFQRIEIHIHEDNVASVSVASKLGAEYEGVFRNKLFFNGRPVPAKCYSVIPSDFKS